MLQRVFVLLLLQLFLFCGFSSTPAFADPAIDASSLQIVDHAPSSSHAFAPASSPSPVPAAAAALECKPKAPKTIAQSLKTFAPILILLAVVAFVLSRLPKVEGVNHTKQFRIRRVLNWLPLGLTYAFLYMGRYNIKVSQYAFEEMKKLDIDGNPILTETGDLVSLMTNSDFATIFGVGTFVYGCAFLINGPLTDKYGGKFAITLGASGSLIANALMGFCAYQVKYNTDLAYTIGSNLVLIYSLLYAFNMYFQSFGAVAIVKVNAPWFHIRERGVFGAIFGILISLGVYFAFDISGLILGGMGSALDACDVYPGLSWVFFMPSILLLVALCVVFFLVKNTPGEAGQEDFALGDASDDDDGEEKTTVQVFKSMLTNPVILTIAGIEFCSGFLRQAIMQWYTTFAKQTNEALHLYKVVVETETGTETVKAFVYGNWGLLLCCAGIMGGVFAGVISDRVFQSRRGPVAAILYGFMLLGAIALSFMYDMDSIMIGDFALRPQAWLVIVMSMCIIGVHGMLSGTASMDFGGKKNVGVAVGIIDGFVYTGTAVMSLTYSLLLPEPQIDAITGNLTGPATDPSNWSVWPLAMIPVSILGLFLARKVWNATPKNSKNKAS